MGTRPRLAIPSCEEHPPAERRLKLHAHRHHDRVEAGEEHPPAERRLKLHHSFTDVIDSSCEEHPPAERRLKLKMFHQWNRWARVKSTPPPRGD